jgi:leucyl-tRNA synthetase
VLHLLYARFWHKVLHDLGHVSSEEPFHRLFNQGYIQAHAYRDQRGQVVEAAEVVERGGRWFWGEAEVTREYGKMGKSLKNVVTPDEMYDTYGADTFRLYEMAMGPLDTSRPWNTRDVVGMQRFLQRVWRLLVDEETGAVRVADGSADDETSRVLHRTIDGVAADMEGLRFNTAIAKLIELTNHLMKMGGATREVADALVLMLAPLAPHLAEELWARLGHAASLAWQRFPVADAAYLLDEQVEIGVSVNGKPRARVRVPAGADDATHEALARGEERVAALVDGRPVRKVVVVPGRLVNFVLG